MTEEQILAFLKAFQTCKSLTSLDLSVEFISINISKSCANSPPPQQYNDIGEQGASEIANWLQINSTLQCLSIVGTGIDESGAIAIGNALKYNSSLKSLNLSVLHFVVLFKFYQY